jgi:glutamate carboxypeptidase
MRQLLDFCTSELPWLLDTTRTLVRHESPSTDKAAADACGRVLARALEAIGGRVQIVERATVGDHVIARFGDGRSRVLLLGHFDTVWPVGELARQPLREDQGRLYGPGVYDMKAGVALAMLAVRAIRAGFDGLRQPGSLVFLFTSDEETGSESSRALIEDQARGHDAVLVLEPSLPEGAVKTFRKGCGQYRIRARGIAAHAGVEPEKGASAVHELARQVVNIVRLNDPERGTTLNVGTMAGGTRCNVVAECAEAQVDVRATTGSDAGRLDAALRALRSHDPRVTIDVEGGIDRPPLERTAGVIALYEAARVLAAELGRTLGEGGTGGGSDGNFTAALGVPTLDGLGAVGGGAHAVGEYIEIDELPWRAALLAGLLRQKLSG